MCLARVRLADREESADPLMAEMARIERTEEGLVMTSLLGERRIMRGAIKSIDFMESTVVVEAGKKE